MVPWCSRNQRQHSEFFSREVDFTRWLPITFLTNGVLIMSPHALTMTPRHHLYMCLCVCVIGYVVPFLSRTLPPVLQQAPRLILGRQVEGIQKCEQACPESVTFSELNTCFNNHAKYPLMPTIRCRKERREFFQLQPFKEDSILLFGSIVTTEASIFPLSATTKAHG